MSSKHARFVFFCCAFLAVSNLVGLRELAIAQGRPEPVAQFQTLESAFAPEIHLNTNVTEQFFWTWSDGSTNSSYPVATIDFGSATNRLQALTVDPPSALTAINLGFDGSDGGWTNRYSLRPPEGVAAMTFTSPLTNLQLFAASYNPITNTLDFSGFNSLQNVELFHCTNLQHVVVSNLPSLKRVCFEACDLQELDLSGNLNLEDVRGALNAYTEVKLGPGVGPKIWHWCFRNNPQITQNFQDLFTNFYSLKEPWIWGANQSGALTFVSSNLTDVEVFGNRYTFADFSNQTNMFECLVNDNYLTNLVINNCTRLQWLDAGRNHLTTTVLDNILAFLDTSAHQLQILNLSNNFEFPSSKGYAHYTSLVKRGVAVQVDVPDPRAPKISVIIQSDPPGRSFAVDGIVYTRPQTNLWTPGSNHSISATAIQSGGAGIEHVLNGWDDGGAASHIIAPQYDSTTYTARFSTRYFLRISGGPNGRVSPASGWQAAGVVVPIAASPNPGYFLQGWTGIGPGSYAGTENPSAVAMNGPVTEAAAFSIAEDLLRLTKLGNGSVVPDYNGKLLQIGRRFTVTARPAAGYVLSNWTGGVIPSSMILGSTSNLSFIMQSNLVLHANFIPNPFLPVKGAYQGLFSDNGNVQQQSSGCLNLLVTDRGTYSGSLVAAGTRFSLGGQFSLDGTATETISRSGSNYLTLALGLDLTPGAAQILGSVSNAHWVSTLRADRTGFDARTNPATKYIGKYTLVIPGTNIDRSYPEGWGWATLLVDAGGKVTLSGSLADGSLFNQTMPVSARGEFGIYSSLYGGRGSVFGWMSFTNLSSGDLHGPLAWIKPVLPGARFYPAGFTLSEIDAFGSRYTPPASSVRALSLTNGLVSFSGGNLAAPFNDAVSLSQDNKITNSSSNSLAMTFALPNGTFSGNVTPPASSRAIPFKGVLLQKQNAAYGYFLGTSQSGQVGLTHAP